MDPLVYEVYDHMKASNQGLNGNSVVIYGPTGFVGRAICLQAHNAGYKVIGIGRNKSQTSCESIEADFSVYSSLVEATSNLLSRSELPKALIFCHRSRMSSRLSEADALLQSTAIEINPYLALKQGLENSSRKGALNIVTVTSNAAFRYAQDVYYNYHIVKHAQVAASIGLSLIPTTLQVFSNVISFGEAADTSKREHDHQHKRLFSMLSGFTLNKPVPTIDDIARAAIMFCDANSMGLSGQTLTVDSGLGCLTQESLARSFNPKG